MQELADHTNVNKHANIVRLIFRPAVMPSLALLGFSLIIIIISLIQFDSSGLGGADWPLHISLAAIFWLVFYVIASYSAFRTVYLISNAYILSLLLFHLSVPLMLAMGLVEDVSWTAGQFSRWVAKAGWVLILALGSYGVGASLSLFSQRTVTGIASPRDPVALRSMQFVQWQAYGLLLASLVFFVFALMSYGNLLEYKRQELYASGADSRGLKVFMMLFPGAVMAFAVAAVERKGKLIGYGLVVFSMVLFMLAGYRSAALFSGLVGAVVWVKSGRNIPTIIAVSIIFVVLVSISIVGIFRQLGSYDELGANELKESYEKSSIERSLLEMGQALGVSAHVFRLVPAENGYIYGSSYLKAISEMVPNIGYSMDRSDGRGGLGDNLKMGQDVVSQMAPSDWLTYKIKRDQFDIGGGVGFSTLAEPYLNFGIFGVVGFFVILGYSLIRFDKVDLLYNKYAFIFAVAMIWPLMRTVRNDFSNFLKPLGFIIIILVFWSLILKILGVKNR